jgi:CRP-like cAMP-binding protein
VIRDGRLVGTLAEGDCFGEIALLRDQPRTATVRASTHAPLRVSVLHRRAYLTAVTGYPASAAAGEEVVKSRLDALEAALAQPPAIRDTATRDDVRERS